jgi:hypothetical protein
MSVSQQMAVPSVVPPSSDTVTLVTLTPIRLVLIARMYRYRNVYASQYEARGLNSGYLTLRVEAIYFQKRQPYMYATLLLKQEGGDSI